MFRYARPRRWTDLVFHVLAHVRATAHLPASVYDDVYTSFVAKHAGPASERTLEEDATLLGSAFPDHTSLARAQLVAGLFDTAESAQAQATTDLGALDSSPSPLIDALSCITSGVELLRCASLLEAPTLDALPPAIVNEPALNEALRAVVRASPTLPRYSLVPVRPLRLRGRLVGDEIRLGIPSDELELTPTHTAWQAAHEATVGEVTDASRASGGSVAERQIEHLAVVLMTERASATGAGASHARWLAHFGELPEPHRDALPASSQALLRKLTSSDAGA